MTHGPIPDSESESDGFYLAAHFADAVVVLIEMIFQIRNMRDAADKLAGAMIRGATETVIDKYSLCSGNYSVSLWK
jgi:hypothetical protein